VSVSGNLLFQSFPNHSISYVFYRLAIPLVWCLTSCRTQSVYDTIWKQLKKIAKRMDMQWKVKKCMMDFERAVINSFHEAVRIIKFFDNPWNCIPAIKRSFYILFIYS
jgi:hypothetical protein